MSTHSNETPGQQRGGLVWSADEPSYPALDALATFDLASEAVREYQRILDTGRSEPAARREAAQIGDGLNPSQTMPAGLDSVAVADEAIARYRDHQARGLDHSAAWTEAAIHTSTAHTQPVGAQETAAAELEQAADLAAERDATAAAGESPPEELQPAKGFEAFAREQYEANRRLPGEGEDAHYDRVVAEYEQAHPDWGRDGVELRVGGLLHQMPEHERPVREQVPEQDTPAAEPPAVEPERAPDPPPAAEGDTGARVDAAMRRDEHAIDRADTELPAHRTEPAPVVEPAAAEADRGVGEVSL